MRAREFRGRQYCPPEFGFPMNRQPPPRQPRQHVFRQPNVVGTQVTATVKWFDPERGFGFVTLGEQGKDALIPASIVVPAGHATLPEGATVVVDLVEDRKGKQVSALHSVDLSTAAPARPPRREGGGFGGDRGGDRGGARDYGPRERNFGDRGGDRGGFDRGGRGAPRDFGARDSGPRGGAPAPRRDAASGPTSEMSGTVKWFNTSKGFGFASPDDGGRDVFIPARALERAGLRGLDDGQRVRMTVRQGEKGMEAVSLSAE
ncbi:Cold shock protein of CSP family [Azospirillum doebereinerae]